MQFFQKIVFRFAIGFICVWVLFFLIKRFENIEFTDDRPGSVCESIYFAGLPAAILLTLAGIIKRNDRAFAVAIKVVLTCFVSAITFLMIAVLGYTSTCRWTTDYVLLESKQNPSVKIVQRGYKCNSSYPKSPFTGIFEIHEFLGLFILVKDADLSKINSAEWVAKK
jgi:uncharacterized membrane protein